MSDALTPHPNPAIDARAAAPGALRPAPFPPHAGDSAAVRMAPLLAELNQQQRDAVRAGDEPLLIVAGAGTGKTMTLAHRVAYLIASGVEPGRILLLTFTRRAAAEMLRRVEAILRRMAEAERAGAAGAVDADAAKTAGAAGAAGGGAAEDPADVGPHSSSDIAAAASAGAGGCEAERASAADNIADAADLGPRSPGDSPAAAGTSAAAATRPGEPNNRAQRVWGGTFHAVAARLLRRYGAAIGLDPGFTIMDRGDAEDLLNVSRTELGLARNDRRFPQKGTCLDIYSRCVNSREKIEPVLAKAFPWCAEYADDLKRLFLAYVDAKAAHNVLDYDDLLLYWHGLLRQPQAGDSVRRRFDAVLVDEYQDTNYLQAGILRMLRPDGRGLTVVGDDAQSIYSFRAATVRNILDFPGEYPETRVVTMEQNYRCTQPLLEATNRVIAQAKERHAKDLWSRRAGGGPPALVTCQDEDEQTEFLIRRILEHREGGLLLHRQAVLFRASHHSLALEVELGRRNIPYHKYGGLKFVEMAHIKDLMAFLRLAENPRDLMAGTRVLLLLPGIGPKKAKALMDELLQAGGDFTPWRAARPPAAAATVWPGFVDMMAALAGPSAPSLPAQIHRIRTFYKPLLEQTQDNAQARLQDLEQLEQISARFPDRSHFLAELVLDPPSYTGDLAGDPALDEDYLILSTMHSAKGLEWDAVYVIHAADGNIPSDMATGDPDEIEEERRLFYVALTRARDWLYVCVPLRYYTAGRRLHDRHGYAQPSRFLSGKAAPWFQLMQAVEGGPEAGTPVEAAAQAAESIRADIRSLWQ